VSESMLPEKIMTVLTIGMDSRKQAIFRMAFKMYTVERYRLSDDAPDAVPDIAIIDMDCVGAQALWDEFRAKHPTLPAIMATVSPADDLPVPVLAKPIRMDSLFPLMRSTLKGITAPKPVKPSSAPKLAPPAPTPRPAAPEPPAAARASPAAEVPPPAKLISNDAPKEPVKAYSLPDSIERFDTHAGLPWMLADIKKSSVPSLVSIAGQGVIVVLPKQDKALLLQDMAVIRQACDTSNLGAAVRPLTPDDTPPRSSSCGLTALIWQTSLWSSRGRLMSGVQPDTPIRLRQWPNLTRLSPIPDAMRIAAFWVRFPVNLRMTVKMLNIPPQHVFNFLAAAHAIGIVEMPESGVEVKAAADHLQSPPSAEKKERAGLLSRLLRKVVGL
jgi:hypothetical protein